MQMFICQSEVVQLEQELALSVGTRHVQILVELAWHLRQRQSHRALELVGEAQVLIASCALELRQRQILATRLIVTQAKVIWLFGKLDQAFALIKQALDQAQHLGSDDLLADAHIFGAGILNDQGQTDQAHGHWLQALAASERLFDPIRLAAIRTGMGIWLAYRDQNAALAQYGHLLSVEAADVDGLHPSCLAAFYDFWGIIATQRSEFAASIEFWSKGRKHAEDVGQLRRAIMLSTNIGDSFNNLNDHHSALEWMQRGLDLARPTDWPTAIGSCLMQMGETLRRLGRLAAALDILSESLRTLAPLAASRSYAIALAYFSELALDRRDWGAAYRTFCQLQHRANALNHPEFQIMAIRGQAHALMELQCPESALVAAHAAYNISFNRQNPWLHISVLKVLADIHARYPGLPAPTDMSVANPQLHYLQLAQQEASHISGYIVTGDLLDALADAHAAANDFDAAYAVARSAHEARDKTHSQETTNRALALQLHYQTERAEAEREHHRQLAGAEAKRVAALQQTTDVLEHLGSIGQEITGHLEMEGLFQALNRHVHRLLDASSFTIYLIDSNGLTLTSAFGVEHGKIIPKHQVELASNVYNSARCIQERREIMINIDPGRDDPTCLPGTLVTLSRLFAPLLVGERVLGVITIQSMQAHAYGERELLIFRTLCAYGAIALDNANAYRQLQQAQSQLVAQEKLAALGSLVAGVAHELNTPIGNSLLMTSALQEKTDEVDAKIATQTLRQADLDEFLVDIRDSASLILRNLSSAAGLVSSFKQVAVDRTSAKRRKFHLLQTCQEILMTLMGQIRLSGHSLLTEIDETIHMDAYPGPLGQVLTNLINNALLHAFDGIDGGKMLLRAYMSSADRVCIEFSDNGVGIPQQNLERVFEPFFTTKTGQGDSGLGMSIIYNIVTSLLGGKIVIHSNVGVGTTFVLDLPLTVESVQEVTMV